MAERACVWVCLSLWGDEQRGEATDIPVRVPMRYTVCLTSIIMDGMNGGVRSCGLEEGLFFAGGVTEHRLILQQGPNPRNWFGVFALDTFAKSQEDNL